ncbi:hypothetical protein [Pseudoalteromonas sp. MT33b]|uniref:hypothetical protein n=1 Tax=Pseudoalteromonas sp. MT33b TaxID=2759705 RepID=UPI0021751613|nr:hypothetical protein [Pseudoalteromonas sp. MT33b]
MAITFHNQYKAYHYSGTNKLERAVDVSESKLMPQTSSDAQSLLRKQPEPSSFLETANEALVY